jgi:hypothetical protein
VVFYDRNGDPVAYTDDGEYVYLFNGSAVGHLVRDSVYAYDGTHLGWFIDGWIRDHDGHCVYFTDDAEGGPVSP